MEMENEQNLNRIPVIDIMRGLGIILVVMGRISCEPHLSCWIYSFHMPLFFFISGMSFFVAGKKMYIWKQVKHLLIPYLFFSILSFVYWRWFELPFREDTDVNAMEQFLNIFIAKSGGNSFLYNVVLWFLPCLFVSNILFYVCWRLGKYYIFSLILFSFIVGFVCSYFYPDFNMPFCLNQSFCALPILGTGYWIMSFIKQRSGILLARNYWMLLFAVSVAIMIVIYIYRPNNDMRMNIYGMGYFLFVVLSFVGIYFIYCLSTLLRFQFLLFLGMNSLLIMLLHEPIKRIVIKIVSLLLSLDVEITRSSLGLILLCTGLVISIQIPIVIFINKHLRFLLGKW